MADPFKAHLPVISQKAVTVPLRFIKGYPTSKPSTLLQGPGDLVSRRSSVMIGVSQFEVLITYLYPTY